MQSAYEEQAKRIKGYRAFLNALARSHEPQNTPDPSLSNFIALLQQESDKLPGPEKQPIAPQLSEVKDHFDFRIVESHNSDPQSTVHYALFFVDTTLVIFGDVNAIGDIVAYSRYDDFRSDIPECVRKVTVPVAISALAGAFAEIPPVYFGHSETDVFAGNRIAPLLEHVPSNIPSEYSKKLLPLVMKHLFGVSGPLEGSNLRKVREVFKRMSDDEQGDKGTPPELDQNGEPFLKKRKR